LAATAEAAGSGQCIRASDLSRADAQGFFGQRGSSRAAPEGIA
jgi:hypothetical protein